MKRIRIKRPNDSFLQVIIALKLIEILRYSYVRAGVKSHLDMSGECVRHMSLPCEYRRICISSRVQVNTWTRFSTPSRLKAFARGKSASGSSPSPGL